MSGHSLQLLVMPSVRLDISEDPEVPVIEEFDLSSFVIRCGDVEIEMNWKQLEQIGLEFQRWLPGQPDETQKA